MTHDPEMTGTGLKFNLKLKKRHNMTNFSRNEKIFKKRLTLTAVLWD
jgi:hypothetical protein